MSKKDKDSTSSILENKGILAGTIIVIAVISFLIGFFIASGNTGGSTTAVPQDECGAAVMLYANTNLISNDSSATLVAVKERNGIYEITAKNQARNFGFYATEDCTLMFINPYNLKTNYIPVTTAPKPTTSPTPIPQLVKSVRPSTELFVMSYCPFGVQAESAMEPVVNLLGTKADIRIRYIASVSGDSVDSIKSLHGLVEAKEDLRQLCIAKYYPQDLWPYLTDYNKNCQGTSKNASSAAACGANATRNLTIDNRKIETCASGSEGIALLKADEVITTGLKVTASPTLFMNGQKFAGQRTAEAYKQGICARFETPPAECSVNLSAQAAAAGSGSCG